MIDVFSINNSHGVCMTFIWDLQGRHLLSNCCVPGTRPAEYFMLEVILLGRCYRFHVYWEPSQGSERNKGHLQSQEAGLNSREPVLFSKGRLLINSMGTGIKSYILLCPHWTWHRTWCLSEGMHVTATENKLNKNVNLLGGILGTT